MRTIQQDMLALTEGILFHQVNCEGVMGGGIALAMARKFPGLEEEYQRFCRVNVLASRRPLLGKTFIFQVAPKLYIANIFGQSFAVKRHRQTNYEAVVEAFENFIADRNRLVPVSWPYYFPHGMGCGLGGGEWSIYSAIIEHYFPTGTICQYNV